MSEIARVQYITQTGIEGFSEKLQIGTVCSAGAEWIQLRLKNSPEEYIRKVATEVLPVCKAFGAKLIINDFVEIAAEVQADGVHLGQTDMTPEEARKILGAKAIIGGTANTFEDIIKLVGVGVNYIGLGPFRFTKTKENLSPVLGLDGYTKILNRCRASGISLPIIAIGGILADDIPGLIRSGVYGIAISSAISNATDRIGVMKKILSETEKVVFEQKESVTYEHSSDNSR